MTGPRKCQREEGLLTRGFLPPGGEYRPHHPLYSQFATDRAPSDKIATANPVQYLDNTTGESI